MTVDSYLAQLPEERRIAMDKLRNTFLENLPIGFEETINYGMIGYVVPHGIYPKGYHCDPKLPLPFIGLGSQKSHIAIYHVGIYSNPELLAWFQTEYHKHSKTKLDMGKSCIRFKNMANIPYDLLAELAKKMTVEDWISIYEKELEKGGAE